MLVPPQNLRRIGVRTFVIPPGLELWLMPILTILCAIFGFD